MTSVLRASKPKLQLIRDSSRARSDVPCVLAVGAFDGMHLGHQALLRALGQRARLMACDTGVVTFAPLPRAYFAPGSLLTLMPTFERVRALREAGVGRLRLMRFNQALSNMSAEQFVRRVLFEEMKALEVWVGEDFRFGHKRSGDVALLQELGTHYGFSVNTLMRMDAGGSRVSATRVRAALKSADFTEAARLLGRPYSYARRVIHGHKLGRKLGYPTANLRWESPTHEFSGIFAVRVSGAGLVRHPAIASLGTRPTVGGVTPLLEVHLFDFDGDLYGHKLEVEFVAKQRDEMKFEGLDPLIEQMRKDCGLAREILAQQKSVQGVSDV